MGIDVLAVQNAYYGLVNGTLDNMLVRVQTLIETHPVVSNIASMLESVRNTLSSQTISATINALVSVNPIMRAGQNLLQGLSGVVGGFINGSHADGLDYVPYDGYIAQLHKGERVLTAQESRDYDGGGGGVRIESGAIVIYAGNGNAQQIGDTLEQRVKQIFRAKRVRA